MPGWAADLVDVFDFATKRLRRRLVGLGDEEYLWEPVPGCWTVKRSADGTWRPDGDPAAWPAPFTTLAWRLAHVIGVLEDPRWVTHLDLGSEAEGVSTAGAPEDAASALARLGAGAETVRSHLRAVDDAALGEIMGPIAAPWDTSDRGAFVLHMLDELIHHAAEAAMVRDLYRASQPANPVVDALLSGDRAEVDAALGQMPTGMDRALSERADLLLQATAQARWDAVPLLLDSGFPIELPDGTSALHHAAGGGDLGAIRHLVDAGADRTIRDPLYQATPAEWADFFGKTEAAATLRALE